MLENSQPKVARNDWVTCMTRDGTQLIISLQWSSSGRSSLVGASALLSIVPKFQYRCSDYSQAEWHSIAKEPDSADRTVPPSGVAAHHWLLEMACIEQSPADAREVRSLPHTALR